MTNQQKDYRTRIYKNYAANFQDAPKIFDKNAAWRWGRAYRYYLQGWLPEDEGANIVDLACGGGRLLYFFKRMGYKNIQGLDISPEQVRLAKQVTPDVDENNVLDWLEAHPSTFELITALDLVEHFQKPEVLRFLDGCYNALKPGGRLILQTPNAESPWGIMHRYHDFTHELAFDPHSLKKLLELCGFVKIEIRPAGPVVHGASSFGRYLIWTTIWAALALWNLAEAGSIGSGIYTRVFLISGVKEVT